jgi:amino acid transporter
MTTDTAAAPTQAPAARGSLGTAKIVFFVIAATAPMAAMVGTVPYGFVLGTGAGMPAAYVLAGLIMFCFVAGYAAISRQIVNAGALYAYIRAALGRVPGGAAAWLAVLSYNTVTIGCFAVFGYFANLLLAVPGVTWHWYTAVALVLTALLGRRQIELSARVLGVLICAEILILVVMDFGILAHRGTAALPAVSFAPGTALGPGLGAALTFAFTCFAGIESAALYGEEARDPRRTVARASYWAVVIVAVFYSVTSWLAVGGVGASQVRARAAKDLGDLFFKLNTQYTSSGLTTVMGLLLLTSVLATSVAMHNATSRYMYALGREGLLPRWLGEVHPRFQSPHRASAAQLLLSVLVIGAFALAGLDPCTNLAVSLISLGTVGIMVLLLGTSLAIIVYFARNAGERRRWWSTVTAPVLALTGLGTAIVLVLWNYHNLTGTDSVVVNGLTVLIPLAALAGAARTLWLRARRPDAYQALGQGVTTASPAMSAHDPEPPSPTATG